MTLIGPFDALFDYICSPARSVPGRKSGLGIPKKKSPLDIIILLFPVEVLKSLTHVILQAAIGKIRVD